MAIKVLEIYIVPMGCLLFMGIGFLVALLLLFRRPICAKSAFFCEAIFLILEVLLGTRCVNVPYFIVVEVY